MYAQRGEIKEILVLLLESDIPGSTKIYLGSIIMAAIFYNIALPEK